MKILVVLAILAAIGCASAGSRKLEENVLKPESTIAAKDETSRAKRQFGFGGSASGAESLGFQVNTPLGGFGIQESASFANQNQAGLGFGGLGGLGGQGSLANANAFNAEVQGPFGGGIGFGGSQASSGNVGGGFGGLGGFGGQGSAAGSNYFNGGVRGPFGGGLGVGGGLAGSGGFNGFLGKK